MTNRSLRVSAGCVDQSLMPEDLCSGRSRNFHRARRRLHLGQGSFECLEPVVSAEGALVLRHRIMASRPNGEATAMRQDIRKIENNADLELMSIAMALRRVRT